MEYRPVILMIPKDTEHVTVSCLVGNELIEDEYDMSDIKKAFLNPEKERCIFEKKPM